MSCQLHFVHPILSKFPSQCHGEKREVRHLLPYFLPLELPLGLGWRKLAKGRFSDTNAVIDRRAMDKVLPKKKKEVGRGSFCSYRAHQVQYHVIDVSKSLTHFGSPMMVWETLLLIEQ